MHFRDLIGDQAMRLTVDSLGCLLAGGIDEAVDLTRLVVEPVLQVFDAVLGLRFQVFLMSPGHGLCRKPLNIAVDIHV